MEIIPNVKNKLNETYALFLLEKVIPKDESLYLWCYSSSKELVATTCPQAYKLESLFSLFETKLSLKEYLDRLDTEKPILFGNELGLQWAVTIIKTDAKRTLFYAIGPVFYQETNLNALKLALRDIKYTHLTITAEEIQKNVPVMSFSIFSRYVLMMHNVLSDTPMELEDLLAPNTSNLLPHLKQENHYHSLVYDNEKALMEMVRRGELNYQDALKKSIIFSSGVPLKSSEFLRQSKTSATVFASLTTRAAMEGGLPPTVAYPLGDSYIQAIEESSSQNEIGSLCYAMYHDFILRVHKLHRNPAYSSAIHKCCDYIEINWDKKIEVEDLASLVGYTGYYLTEKFKKEVGVSLNSYIKKVKVERAKILLDTTDLPVCEVAEKTAFNTSNYFIQVFREFTGKTPVQYRNHKEKNMTNFLIGASTSAHQIEGNNIHSDYWAMENMKYTSFTEPSGQAVDSYNHYEEDIALLKQAGLNAYRFSIEWARIEPEQGKFDMNEIEHYKKVLLCLKENGITPVVTMHHFSSPLWLIQMGGWENEGVVDLFANYCKFVVEQLGDLFDYVCTINEANMRLQFAAIAERYKRQMMANATNMKSMEGTVQVGANLNGMMERMKMAAAENMQIFHSPNPAVFVSACTPNGDLLVMKAHQAAKAVMKQVKPSLKIGITLSLHDIQFVEGGEEVAKNEWNDEFLHYLPYIQDDDFFGLQNYTRSVMNADGIMPVPEGKKKTQMDYENYPEALGHVIRKVHESLPIPIMVTENGITTSDDTERVEFIQKALSDVQACIADGIPVIGYMHWSLLDNFEWQKGFAMTFGLVAVDRTTMQRTPKQSLFVLGSYAK